MRGGMWDCAKTLAQDYEIMIVSNRGNSIQEWRGWATWYWNRESKQDFLKTASKETMREILIWQIDWQSIWKVGKDNVLEYLHPTQKPVEINQRVLENFTAPWETILDLFWGSGSNLIACEKTGRICRMMELDTKYAQTIVKRYIHYTWSESGVKCLNRDFDLSALS